MTRRIYLSLGSNLGDRGAHLEAALLALKEVLAVRQVSSLYMTEPVGVTQQPDFANLAVEADAVLAPLQLLIALKHVEQSVGRRPTFRWGPRVVDIDILLYGDRVLEMPELTIPHREMIQRAFVLLPLAEIAPEIVHPVDGRNIAELAAVVGGADGVHRVDSYDENRSSANGSPSL